MLGYYDNDETTKKVLRDGWFYTGDLGYLDQDGFLHITGRKKDVIVTKNGKNIFPEELETLINRSPYIKESMVYGKLADDGDTLICVDIIVDKEFILGKYSEFPEEDIIKSIITEEVKTVNRKVTLYKHIRQINIRENEFTKTTTQKVKRHIELASK
jgi:long-chain acyl-CoA synthetase